MDSICDMLICSIYLQYLRNPLVKCSTVLDTTVSIGALIDRRIVQQLHGYSKPCLLLDIHLSITDSVQSHSLSYFCPHMSQNWKTDITVCSHSSLPQLHHPPVARLPPVLIKRLRSRLRYGIFLSPWS